MTIYIYKAEGYEKDEFILVDSYEGETNEECERWASDNYADTDIYGWSYTKA